LKEVPVVRENNDRWYPDDPVEMMPVLEDLLKDCRWETAEVLKERYSMPSAFEAYKKVLF
jgi:hypothetical protein